MLKDNIMCLDFIVRHNISSTLPLKCIPTQKIRKFWVGNQLLQLTFKGPHDYAQPNFRIFWVGMHFRGNIEDILWRTIKSKHVM